MRASRTASHFRALGVQDVFSLPKIPVEDSQVLFSGGSDNLYGLGL